MSSDEADRRTIVPGKETVVRRQGADWSFHVPEGHTVELALDGQKVMLSVPLGGASLFDVGGIDNADPEEVVVSLGQQHGWAGPPTFGDTSAEPTGYPLPEIQDEFDRLRARWESAGLDEQEFDAYGRGESHEDKLRSIRHTLRAVERRTSS